MNTAFFCFLTFFLIEANGALWGLAIVNDWESKMATQLIKILGIFSTAIIYCLSKGLLP